jgi:tRNA (adenine22-N1)-methyltransferase
VRESRGARLRAAAGLVPPGHRVADIGSGTGALPRLLLASGRVSHCIATEPTRALLGKVRRFPSIHPLSRRLELRCGDGLRPLTPADRVETVMITGLGARSIVRILADRGSGTLVIRRFVLQAQSESARLRRWLTEHRQAIVDEVLVRERGRFYELIAAEPGDSRAGLSHPGLGEDDLYEIGPCLARSGDALVGELWRRHLRRFESILARADPGNVWDDTVRRRDQARRILRALVFRT